ncbi:hypothetical protein FRB95_004625 [Tulasnella sp. JGI-2019a]|nr:hypothetical protein FRB93_000014 [Tulasnella sp. JGI-2019a]KAG9030038.1 hypothetical protein FRB95_004625 [Tulasnella sp. JGI-2019a]
MAPATKPVLRVAPTTAPAPFDRDSPGDCILRSSDGIEYKVFRNILTLASSVFDNMFAIPPTVDVTEGATAVLPTALASNIGSAVEMINMFDKYDIKTDSSSLRAFLQSVTALPERATVTEALGAYAMAWRLNLKEDALRASRYLHLVDLHDENIIQNLLKWSGSVHAMLALWDLRVRREEAIHAILEVIPPSSITCSNHRQRVESSKIRNNVRIHLATPYPTCGDVKKFFRLRQLVDTTASCTACSNLTGGTRTLTATEVEQGAELIRAFPQTVKWSRK